MAIRVQNSNTVQNRPGDQRKPKKKKKGEKKNAVYLCTVKNVRYAFLAYRCAWINGHKPMAAMNEIHNRLANAHNDMPATQMFMLRSVA